MRFTLKKKREQIISVARRIGYTIIPGKYEGEYNLIRALNYTGYPRFHLYIKESDNDYSFNLHLDQKRPVYQGTSAHSGEYDGELVDGEMERIQKAF